MGTGDGKNSCQAWNRKPHNVFKKYGDTGVVHGLDLKIDDGDFCVVVGPSGCDKSTLLRMIAGLEETSSDRVHIGPRDVTDEESADRGIAMVFQTYALYPHMSVGENVGFGLRMNKAPAAGIRRKVGEASRILQRKPQALSGG